MVIWTRGGKDRAKCPFSSFKLAPFYEQNGAILSDKYGFRNVYDISECDAIVLGSSVVFGEESGSMTDFIHKHSSVQCYNISFNAWRLPQIINQYLYRFIDSPHKYVVLYSGYNEYLNNMSSTFDRRPGHPYNFYWDEIINDDAVWKSDETGYEIDLKIKRSHSELQDHLAALAINEFSGERFTPNDYLNMWISNLRFFSCILQSYHKKFICIPHIHLLDKPRPTSGERLIIDSWNPQYVNAYPQLAKSYWRCVHKNLDLFRLVGTTEVLSLYENSFIDSVHFTDLAYEAFAKAIARELD